MAKPMYYAVRIRKDGTGSIICQDENPITVWDWVQADLCRYSYALYQGVIYDWETRKPVFDWTIGHQPYTSEELYQGNHIMICDKWEDIPAYIRADYDGPA